MTDRQPESVTAPEWVMEAAWAAWRLSSQTLGNQAAILGAIANAILAAYAASEEARKVERLEAALDKIAGFAPGNGDVCEVIARIARAGLASPLVEETR